MKEDLKMDLQWCEELLEKRSTLLLLLLLLLSFQG